MHELAGRARFARLGAQMTRRVTQVVCPDSHSGDSLTDRDAQDSQRSTCFNSHSPVHAKRRKAQAQEQFAERLDELAHGRRHHVGFALVIATDDRDAGDKEDRRCDRLHG